MKTKIFTFIFASICFIEAYSQALSITNGSFETGSTPCLNGINNATGWNGLLTLYTSCGSYSDYKDPSGGYADVTRYMQNSCASGDLASDGTRFAKGWINGYYPGGQAVNSFVYQQMTNNASSSNTYRFTGYVKGSVNGFPFTPSWSGGVGFGVCFVNTSVGSSASAILGNVRSQSSAGTIPTPTFTLLANGYYRMTVDWTPSSTSSYYIVIGNMLFCDDGNYTNVQRWILDDLSISCKADAGDNKSFTCSCCTGGCAGVVIGTAASGSLNYSWTSSLSPSGLSCTNCATPTAIPSTTTTYTLTVSGSYCSTSTDFVTVTKTYSTSCCGPKSMVTNPNIEEKILLYPNPSSNGIINIEFLNLGELNGTFEVYDISGRIIINKEISNKTIQIDLSKEAAGTYWVKSIINGEIQVNTFLKE